MSEELWRLIHSRIARGRVIPFLGAAANLAERPRESDWQRDGFLPNTRELTRLLAERSIYADDRRLDLLRVAQYLELELGEDSLFEAIRESLTGKSEPNAIHHYLATRRQRTGSEINPWPIIVTTNYDDMIERAFDAAGEPYDVVSYFALPDAPGEFRHRLHDGTRHVISRSEVKDYGEFDLEQRTIILKLHGSLDRDDSERDSFVITEDHYIAYMVNDDAANGLPAALLAELRKRHFLFLGYSLSDWNLRVTLLRIWLERTRGMKSWAVQLNPRPIDQQFWARHGVGIVYMDLAEWVGAMAALDE
jgi:hypothetical protein